MTIFVFQKNTRVTSLDLHETGLHGEGGKYVAAMLLENDFLYAVVGATPCTRLCASRIDVKSTTAIDLRISQKYMCAIL